MITEIKEKVLLVSISNTYDKNNTELQNFNATRAAWKAEKNRLDKVDYVFGVYKNKVVTVYKVDKWIAAEPIRKDLQVVNLNDRYMFGETMKDNFNFDELSNTYINGDELAKKFKFYGNPIRYINV